MKRQALSKVLICLDEPWKLLTSTFEVLFLSLSHLSLTNAHFTHMFTVYTVITATDSPYHLSIFHICWMRRSYCGVFKSFDYLLSTLYCRCNTVLYEEKH